MSDVTAAQTVPKFLPGHTVGIDLGTSSSAIAQLNPEGEPTVLKNSADELTTASVVILGENGRVTVGPSLERMTEEDPDRVVMAIKREMGNPGYSREYEGRRMTPELISSLILMKVKQDAEARIGTIKNAVITVPYYFTDPCRRATQYAGRISGLNVVDIINEPTAATLAYAWQRGELGSSTDKPEKTVVVYDLGGGTFDVTVVRYTPTRFRVLATDGDVLLGGLDWSRRMAEYCCDQFREWFAADPRDDEQVFAHIVSQCEIAKRRLSEQPRANVGVEFAGQRVEVEFTPQRFYDLTADLLQRTADTTELVMQEAGVTPDKIDDILLVGGSTRMPMVRDRLQQICGRAPSTALDPDQAVAHGAAIHAAILAARELGTGSGIAQALLRRLRAVVMTDVNSHALGVLVTDPHNHSRKFNHVMIPKNSPLPFQVTQRFVTTVPNQRQIDIHVLEGEAADPSACHQVTAFRIGGLPDGLPVGSPVELTYRYDENGRIHITGRELVGNTDASTTVLRNAPLDESTLDEALRRLATEYSIE